MYVIIPNILLNSEELSHKCFYVYTNKALVINELDTLKYKIKLLGTVAATDNRGCVIDSHPHDLVQLCNKYGGVVQCLRTGRKIHVCQNGSALETWSMVGKPYQCGDVLQIKGEVLLSSENETYTAPIVHLTNNINCVTFIRHITDIPEVVDILKHRPYRN